MKILFVTTNAEEVEGYTRLFKAHFPKLKITYAATKGASIDLIQFSGPFSFVCIDADSKELDPLEITNELMEMTGEKPIIYFGKKINIDTRVLKNDVYEETETKKLIQHPIDPQEFIKAVKDIISWLDHEKFEESIIEAKENEFISLKIKNFYFFNSFDYDVFLKVTSKKYSLLIPANESYTEGFIQKYVKNYVRFLYLKKNDHIEYLEKTIKSLIKLLEDTKLTLPQRILLQIRSVAIIHEYLNSIGVSEGILELALACVNHADINFQEAKSLGKVLSQFPLRENTLAEQAVLCQYVCMAMCAELHWDSDSTKNKLGLSAILQDCALETEELSHLTGKNDPSFATFKEKEKKEYLAHPGIAAKIAQEFSSLAEMDFIVEQHHETPDGNGFPQGINSHKITSVSACFNLATLFTSQLAFRGLKKTIAADIINELKGAYNTGVFKGHYTALKKLFS